MKKEKQRKVFPTPELYTQIKDSLSDRRKDSKGQLRFDFDEAAITRPWECQRHN